MDKILTFQFYEIFLQNSKNINKKQVISKLNLIDFETKNNRIN